MWAGRYYQIVPPHWGYPPGTLPPLSTPGTIARPTRSARPSGRPLLIQGLANRRVRSGSLTLLSCQPRDSSQERGGETTGGRALLPPCPPAVPPYPSGLPWDECTRDQAVCAPSGRFLVGLYAVENAPDSRSVGVFVRETCHKPTTAHNPYTTRLLIV